MGARNSSQVRARAVFLVLFDVDGTLVDSQHMIVAAMTAAFEAERRPVPERDAVLGVVGLSLVEAMEALVPGIEPAAARALAEAYKAAFQALRQAAVRQEPLYPGALDAIRQIGARPDVVLGIATGKSRRGVRSIIDLHGLDGRFATIQTADDHPSKPHPSMILTALAETGVAPERAVILGDSAYDMDMAAAAGIHAVGVSWGYQDPASLAARGAHRVLERFDEAYPVLSNLFGWSDHA